MPFQLIVFLAGMIALLPASAAYAQAILMGDRTTAEMMDQRPNLMRDATQADFNELLVDRERQENFDRNRVEREGRNSDRARYQWDSRYDRLDDPRWDRSDNARYDEGRRNDGRRDWSDYQRENRQRLDYRNYYYSYAPDDRASRASARPDRARYDWQPASPPPREPNRHWRHNRVRWR